MNSNILQLQLNKSIVKNFKYNESDDFDESDFMDLNFLMFLSMLRESISHIQNRFDILDNVENAKKQIFYILTDENSILPEDIPTRKFLGMNIVYLLGIDIGDNTLQSIPITNDLSKELGLSEVELYECAKENTPKMFPIKITKDELLKEILNSKLDICKKNLNDLSVISNEVMINGTTCLLYDDTMQRFADEYLTGNIIVLPISCHRSLVCIMNEEPYFIKTELRNVLKENLINKSEDPVSSNVFLYDRSSKLLKIL